MYINWAHHYIPKFSGTCSFLINFLLIYLVKNDSKVRMGNYRYLLMFFAIYNLTSTISEEIVPTGVLDHRYAFSMFIVDGGFEQRSELGTIFLCIRCSFVSAAYGILQTHFIYRYLALFRPEALKKHFLPFGLIVSVLYCGALMFAWFLAGYVFLNADSERLEYLRDGIAESFHTNVSHLNIIVALYNEASPEVVTNSWIGMSIAIVISSFSATVYFVCGFLIVKKLKKEDLLMSGKTKLLQKQLVKALAVQAAIPMFVNFLPVFFACILPAFNIDIGQWINWISVMAISFFPVLDPLALFYFIPAFRKRFIDLLTRELSKDKSSGTPKTPS